MEERKDGVVEGGVEAEGGDKAGGISGSRGGSGSKSRSRGASEVEAGAVREWQNEGGCVGRDGSGSV